MLVVARRLRPASFGDLPSSAALDIPSLTVNNLKIAVERYGKSLMAKYEPELRVIHSHSRKF